MTQPIYCKCLKDPTISVTLVLGILTMVLGKKKLKNFCVDLANL